MKCNVAATTVLTAFKNNVICTLLVGSFGFFSPLCYSQQPLRQLLETCYETDEPMAKLACYDEVVRQITVNSGKDEGDVGNPTVGEQEPSALDQRFDFEQQASENQFIIIPHRPNYILLYSYSDHLNDAPSSPTREPLESSFEQLHSEAKFQISFKVQLGRNLLPDPMSFWFAYTQLSFWQVYNKALSAPFRESNYEPELIFQYHRNFNLFGYSSDRIVLGFSHQSNGRAEPLSRSWNRIYSAWIFSQGNLSLSVKPWWRIPEAHKEDDNPDIQKYIGYAAFGSTYKYNQDVVDLRLYNNFRSADNRTSLQLSYSFPLRGRLKGFIQYVNGYGESLLDYNHRIKRIGLGILLTDWY
jgi:phospholipase A1/A2